MAAATLRCLRRHVPAAVPGVVFLSGGQNDVLATRHLDAINRARRTEALEAQLLLRPRPAGRGARDLARQPDNVDAAQRAFQRRARCNGLAAMGAYAGEEDEPRWGAAAAAAPPA